MFSETETFWIRTYWFIIFTQPKEKVLVNFGHVHFQAVSKTKYKSLARAICIKSNNFLIANHLGIYD